MMLTALMPFSVAIFVGLMQAPANGPQVRVQRLPANVEIAVVLEKFPGMNSVESFWEGSYEVRVADWKEVVQATEAGTNLDLVGKVIERGSWKAKQLNENRRRQIGISVPVKEFLKHRLKQQSTQPQAFLLRSTVRIFDGELKQNFAMQVDRVWEAKLFPDGKAKITIKIEPDGSYSVWGPVPKKQVPVFTITTDKP